MSRRWIVLTDGYLTERNAKTAHGILRYARNDVVAVLDPPHAGKRVSDLLPDLGSDAPIVAEVREAIEAGGTALLLGVATPGGWMPEHWKVWINEAVDQGVEIVNGLHTFLKDDVELAARAQASGARLWDVREVPPGIPLCSGKSLEAPQKIVATVGSDCSVGKMTVSLELVEAARASGVAAEFVPTGQTGIMIAGRGIAVDRVISDFVAGAAEKLVLDSDPSSEVLVVEGQGSVWHPAYSGVTLGLLHGSAPHLLVFCHRAHHTHIEEPPFTELPPLNEMIETYEALAKTLRPAKVVSIAVNCRGLSDEEADAALRATEEETGLPAADVMRGGGPKLWAPVAEALGS